MNLWRLEWLRLFRTKRIIGLVGIWVFFGLLGQLTARYLADIITSIDDTIDVTLTYFLMLDSNQTMAIESFNMTPGNSNIN